MTEEARVFIYHFLLINSLALLAFLVLGQHTVQWSENILRVRPKELPAWTGSVRKHPLGPVEKIQLRHQQGLLWIFLWLLIFQLSHEHRPEQNSLVPSYCCTPLTGTLQSQLPICKMGWWQLPVGDTSWFMCLALYLFWELPYLPSIFWKLLLYLPSNHMISLCVPVPQL